MVLIGSKKVLKSLHRKAFQSRSSYKVTAMPHTTARLSRDFSRDTSRHNQNLINIRQKRRRAVKLTALLFCFIWLKFALNYGTFVEALRSVRAIFQDTDGAIYRFAWKTLSKNDRAPRTRKENRPLIPKNLRKTATFLRTRSSFV